MILAISLLTGDTTLVIPSLLFTGIITGLMNKQGMNETITTALISFIVGSVIAMIISLITIYYTEGELYAIAVIQYSWVYIVFYTFIGCIGSAVGYYIKDEIKNRG